MFNTVPFESLYAEPSRNGLTKPKAIRGVGTKIVNMGELYAYPRMLNIVADRAPLSQKEKESYLLKEGDLLFARQSLVPEGAGKCSIFLGDREEVTFESHIIRVRLNLAKADPRFYYYYFRSAVGRDVMESIVEQGAGVAGIRASDLSCLEIDCPDPKDQRSIAHILSILDDKIELNARMNKTLSAMARAIFKSWFVDYDPVFAKAEGRDTGLPKRIADLFAAGFVDSELGEIPEGWKTQPFTDTVEIIGGGTPKTSVAEYWNGDIPWFSVVDAPNPTDIWVVGTEKTITRSGLDNSSTKMLPIGATIISARGTVGRIALVGAPMAMNQSCYGLRGKVGALGFYNYFATRELVEILQQYAHGCVFDTITQETLSTITVAVPPGELVDAFEKYMRPILLRMRSCIMESRTMANLRDTMLPKLISGELKAKDAEDCIKRKS